MSSLYKTSDTVVSGANLSFSVGSDGSLFPDYITPVKKPTVRPSRSVLNRVATSAVERQLMIAAQGAVIPLIYGRQSVGAKLAVIKESGGYLYVLAVWALGLCHAVSKVFFDGKEKPAYIIATYLGTTTQVADPTLAGLIPGYNDALVVHKNGHDIGVCASLLKMPAKEVTSNIDAIIKGKVIYDPRSDDWVYSTNPALCLADFKTNSIYGEGQGIDWPSVTVVANDNDELVGGLKRRELNLSIDRLADTSQHVEALRAYAACFVVIDEVVKLVSDRPVAVSRSISASETKKLKIKKSGTANLPTLMRVVYTDISSWPWKDAEAVAQLPGLTERRESSVKLPGITTYSQAMREAIERLNALHLSDLIVQWTGFDKSLQDQRGDVIEISHPSGLTSKQMRLLTVDEISIGRYRMFAAEYDPLVYSDNIETEPSSPDTTLPSPNNPTPVTNLQRVEELYQQGTGVYASRLRITWDTPEYPYIRYYRVIIKVGVNIVFEATTTSPEIATNAVLELSQHDIEVSVFSGLSYSDAATTIITPMGKHLPPGDVSQLNGFEAGGRVYLAWPEAIDIDIWQYEIRYGGVGVAWADAQLIDRTDSLRLNTDEVAAGDWDFLVKALDSVSNYSVNATRKMLTVTLDSDAFLVANCQFSNPTLMNMHEYTLSRGDTVTHAVSTSGQTWNDLFPDAMNTYINPLLSYQNDTVSEYLSEVWDAGLELSGDWSAEFEYEVISGTVTAQIELSTDNVTWDIYALNSKATARYARIRITSDAGLFLVGWPDMLIRVNSIPRTENGQNTSLTIGPKTITLTNDYAKVKSITITPTGSASRSYSVDNIDLISNPNTYDVYIFDSTGAQVANDFLHDFKGV